MILVEGVSDQIAVETLAARHGRDLVEERVAVVPVGGAGGIGRVLADHASPAVRLAALCDAGEEAQVRRAIDASGLDVSVFVCVADLEDELIRAVGTDRALTVVDDEGELRAFATLQKQRAWRDQPTDLRLRRFLSAGARRKLRYARLFTDEAVDVDRVPQPLLDVLDSTRDRGR